MIRRQHGREHGPMGSDPIAGFIAFDTEPQVGDWLYVETTGADHGWGVTFNDSGENGIKLQSGGDEITFYPGHFNIDVTGAVDISCLNGSLLWDTTSHLDWLIDGPAGYGFVLNNRSPDGYISIGAFGDLDLSGSSITLNADDSISFFGDIFMGLPTSDPGVHNQLWNDGGTVKVSP